jgi:hypothetical protein
VPKTIGNRNSNLKGGKTKMPQAFSREEHSWWIALYMAFYIGQNEINVQIVPLDGLLHRTKTNECSNSPFTWPCTQDKKK